MLILHILHLFQRVCVELLHRGELHCFEELKWRMHPSKSSSSKGYVVRGLHGWFLALGLPGFTRTLLPEGACLAYCYWMVRNCF